MLGIIIIYIIVSSRLDCLLVRQTILEGVDAQKVQWLKVHSEDSIGFINSVTAGCHVQGTRIFENWNSYKYIVKLPKKIYTIIWNNFWSHSSPWSPVSTPISSHWASGLQCMTLGEHKHSDQSRKVFKFYRESRESTGRFSARRIQD